MNNPRWDDKCPHCKKKICVYDAFVNHDYQQEFDFPCPECGETIYCIEVVQVPEFAIQGYPNKSLRLGY